MARTSCPDCGATVDVARIHNTSKHVALEVHGDPSTDAPRYRIIAHRPMRVIPVAGDAVGDFRPDHSWDCPGHNAGRRSGER